MTVDPTIRRRLAPTGRLHVAISLCNGMLAQRREGERTPTGVAVDLAHAIAERLDIPMTLVVTPTVRQAVACAERGLADIGVFAITPARRSSIAFTAPFMVCEGGLMVHEDSSLRRLGDVDCSACTILVGDGSPYDACLSGRLSHARLLRLPTSDDAVELLRGFGASDYAAAAARPRLEQCAQTTRGVRVLDGAFMSIEQAFGVSRDRGPEVAAALSTALEALKRDGVVHEALQRHRVDDGRAAPPARSV